MKGNMNYTGTEENKCHPPPHTHTHPTLGWIGTVTFFRLLLIVYYITDGYIVKTVVAVSVKLSFMDIV